MDVRTYMTDKVVTATGDVRILEALDLMKKHNVTRLPIVQGKHVVGLLTEKLIAKSTPSTATSLSMHEINYLLTKTTVQDIMEKHVITIHPDALLEEAAETMRQHQISVLPVVENDALVGIITHSDVLEAFVDLLGYYKKGTRLTIALDDRVGEFEKVLALLRQENVNINQIAVYHGGEKVQVVLHLASQNADKVSTVLKDAGYPVLSAIVKEGKE
ncbi:CBS domain-containing protein [Granulicatella sp. zg-ZJ]|uniref:CBS and ACT domain-containing protein n=1 Tax=unclassified Granulicatella TaxID=2630493 RepID=UPI0013BFEDF2|nr:MULTISPECIES: CBS and ACT domain-containing protein [unclassified Granulicatella]MBS4749909.1 CBS domain-containing protein [Carnobacteriaceae bacterium zg-ZUI78]NEW62093.1 CBS domain-containing protein [Granulicatella sp. zg-ZJ]NEW66400.1 CBS domain-containing protein [Granulicatella sp. zg-84]QMI86134.1 CBS domain-containing protein [Carnobacteriaceae bacterium zg-84]